MRAYAYILHKLVRVLDRLPPETAPAAILAAIQLSAALAGLPWILDIVVGGFVGWYLKRMFEIHVWSELPPDHQRFLLEMRDLILLKTTDRPTNCDGVGCATVGSRRKLYDRIVRGRSDANIPFEQTRNMLLRLGFEERVRGSHHIFTREGIEELIDIQEVGGECKPYQVKQMRAVLKKYNLRKEL